MKQNRLLEGPVRSVFLSYLVPSVSATLVTSIYILADTMMIGRGIGSVGIAALNILLPLYSTFFGFGMMCGIGAASCSAFPEEREMSGRPGGILPPASDGPGVCGPDPDPLQCVF